MAATDKQTIPKFEVTGMSIGSERFEVVRNLPSDAQQDVLETMHEVFQHIATEITTEASKDHVNEQRLSTLVRIGSQQAVNYRYHASY